MCHYFCTVDDASAQASCVISPDLATLTIRDGLVRNVELHCQCMDDSGIITGASWFYGSTLLDSQSNTKFISSYSNSTALSSSIY